MTKGPRFYPWAFGEGTAFWCFWEAGARARPTWVKGKLRRLLSWPEPRPQVPFVSEAAALSCRNPEAPA